MPAGGPSRYAAPGEPIGSPRPGPTVEADPVSGEIATPAVATFGAPASSLRLVSHSDGSAITVMAAATASRRWSVRSNLNTVPPACARTGAAGARWAIQARNRSTGTQDRRPPSWTPRHAPWSRPRSSAMNRPTWGTQAGRLVAPRWGTGARYGLSVSTSSRSSGQRTAAAWTSVAPLNVTMPEKLTNAPRSRQRRTSSGPPVKQWKIVRAGTPSAARMSNVSVPRVAGVDHERQPVAVRELDLGGERVPLRLARSVVVVVVEPGLADGDDAGCVEQVDDRSRRRPRLRGGGARPWRTRRGGRRRWRSPPPTWPGRTRP